MKNIIFMVDYLKQQVNFYVYALNSNSVVAAPLMSVDSICSYIWKNLFKEKLTKEQYLTIIMICIGVFILGFFE